MVRLRELLIQEKFRKTQRMEEVCITGSLRTLQSDDLNFILDLLPVELAT